MRNLRYGLAVLFAVLMVFSVTAQRGLAQSVPFMDIEDVKPGMKGFGLSVFEGSRIDTFSVEILGIMRNIYYTRHDLIMVRISGPVVDKAGVIAGMSGSPVYVDGKLVGALAYSFGQLPKEPIGAITPIGQMLDIQKAVVNDSQTEENRGGDSVKSGQGMRDMAAPGASPGPPSSFLKPIGVPMVCSGFDPATLRIFEDTFRKKGMIPVQGGGGTVPGGGGRIDERTLEPGAAVGAQLIRGDYNLAATGTVTYRDGNTILAFGHPFLWSGALNIPMTKAEVITVLPDLASSTKLSNTTDAVGSVLWDHTNGLYGQLGTQARMIPARIAYHTGDKLTDTYDFEVVMAAEWTPILVNMAIANTILGKGRMGGERTIQLDGRVKLKGYGDIVLHDLFSGQLTLPALTNDVTSMVSIVLDNPFVTPRIDSIDLSIHSWNDRRTALIEGVWYDRSEVSAGDTLDVTVFLRPYRGDRIMKKISIPLPINMLEGPLQALVGTAQVLTQHELRSVPHRFRPEEAGQLVDVLNQQRTNNRIYIRLYQPNPGGAVKGTEMAGLPPSVLSIMNSDRTNGSFTPVTEVVLVEKYIETDYVVTGQSRSRLTVKR